MPTGIPGKVTIICPNCNEEKEYSAKGLCEPCYQKRYRQTRHEQERRRNELRRRDPEYREKQKERQRDWYRRNRAANLERGRLWRKANPDAAAAIKQRRRAREYNLSDTLTTEQAEHLLGIGRTIYPGEKLHLDHIVPLSKGGGTTLANMQAIPASLNCQKHDVLPEQIYRQEELWLESQI